MSNSGPAETSLGFIERARAGPLSAKADGKPPVLSPVSNRLRAKMIKADLMSRHVPSLQWTQCLDYRDASAARVRMNGVRRSLVFSNRASTAPS